MRVHNAPIFRIMKPMGRKVTIVYTVFSVLAFIAMTSWLAYTIFQTRANNLISAASSFENVRTSLSAALKKQGRFDTPGFRSFVRAIFLQEPTIDSLTVVGAGDEVQYVFARHASQLVAPQVTNNQWSGSVHYNRMTQHLFSADLPLPQGSPPLRVQTVFTILGSSDIYSIARILLICILSFVILTGIVILVVPLFNRAGEPSPPTKADYEPQYSRERRPPEPFVRKTEKSGAAEGHGGRAPAPPPVVAEPAQATDSVPRSERTGESLHQSSQTKPRESIEVQPSELPEVIELHPESQEETRSAPESSSYAATEPKHEDTTETAVQASATSHASPEHESLPPSLQLPSVHEVLGVELEGEAQVSELSLFEELRAQEKPSRSVSPAASSPIEVTEVDGPSSPRTTGAQETSDYRSAEDELEDIDDFEDLEEIDGQRSPETEEHIRQRPKLRPTSPPPQPIEATPESVEVALPEISEPQEGEPEFAEPEVPESFEIELEETIGEEPRIEEMDAADVEELEPIESDDEWAAGIAGGFETQVPASVEVEVPNLGPSEETFLTGPPPESTNERQDESAARSRRTADSEGPPSLRAETASDTTFGKRHSRELFNPESGLAWQEHLEQRLSFELDRAASFDQDLAVCVIRFTKQVDNLARLNYARQIRAYFPFHDLCFEYGRDAFAIVLPNSEIDQAIRSMENFNEKMGEEHPDTPKALFGLSARNGRLLGGDRLLSEADTAVQKARHDGENSIFALRVDPGKYREFIKSTLK